MSVFDEREYVESVQVLKYDMLNMFISKIIHKVCHFS